MFDKLDIFRMAQGVVGHAAARQAAIATNIANADTPGYRAQDVKPFSETYDAGSAIGMRATRAEHMSPGPEQTVDLTARIVERPGAASPNGNTVSLEREMMEGARIKGRHDRALAIYKSALTVLRTSANGGR